MKTLVRIALTPLSEETHDTLSNIGHTFLNIGFTVQSTGFTPITLGVKELFNLEIDRPDAESKIWVLVATSVADFEYYAQVLRDKSVDLQQRVVILPMKDYRKGNKIRITMPENVLVADTDTSTWLSAVTLVAKRAMPEAKETLKLADRLGVIPPVLQIVDLTPHKVVQNKYVQSDLRRFASLGIVCPPLITTSDAMENAFVNDAHPKRALVILVNTVVEYNKYVRYFNRYTDAQCQSVALVLTFRSREPLQVPVPSLRVIPCSEPEGLFDSICGTLRGIVPDDPTVKNLPKPINPYEVQTADDDLDEEDTQDEVDDAELEEQMGAMVFDDEVTKENIFQEISKYQEKVAKLHEKIAKVQRKLARAYEKASRMP